MKICQTNRIFQLTERSFDSPPHMIKFFDLFKWKFVSIQVAGYTFINSIFQLKLCESEMKCIKQILRIKKVKWRWIWEIFITFRFIKLLFTCQNQFDFFVKFTGYRQGKASGNAAFFRGIFNPDQIKETTFLNICKNVISFVSTICHNDSLLICSQFFNHFNHGRGFIFFIRLLNQSIDISPALEVIQGIKMQLIKTKSSFFTSKIRVWI